MSASPPTLPGTLVTLLIDTVARWGVSQEQLLDGSSIPHEVMLKAFWYVDFQEFNRLVARAVELTGEPGLGFHLGKQMTITCLGVIGFAAMVARNFRDALEVISHFLDLRCPVLQVRIEADHGMVRLVLAQRLPDYRLHEAGVTCLTLSLGQIYQTLTGRTFSGIYQLQVAEPDYRLRLAELIDNNVCFEQPVDCVVFPEAILDQPLITSDPQAARLAREQCKKLLGTASNYYQRVTAQVRDLAFDEVLGFCSLDDVASKMNVSRRTLQRQLDDENMAFRDIIERMREEKALVLLREGNRSIADIAEYLGYTDAANFNRAFKRWKGVSASQYRVGMVRTTRAASRT